MYTQRLKNWEVFSCMQTEWLHLRLIQEDYDGQDRILNGKSTEYGEYPWMAGLYKEAGKDDWIIVYR